MRARYGLVIILAAFCMITSACSAHQFVQAGRKTILSLEETNDALDTIAANYAYSAPLDDPKVDENVEALEKAVLSIDASLIAGWVIIKKVEDGPPKLSLEDSASWYQWAVDIIGTFAAVYCIFDINGMSVDGIDKALGALSKFAPLPELNCGGE